MITTKKLQQALKNEGRYNGAIDGKAGPITYDAMCEHFRTSQATPEWMIRAGNDLGIKESEGKKDNPRIVKMHSLVGLPDESDETAWCGSALGAWMIESGIVPPKKSYWAANWKRFGLSSPVKFGSILLFPTNTGSGHHVCLCAGVLGNTVFCIGGNQNNSVNITPRLVSTVIYSRWP